MASILLVCTGNVCRSPIAEGMLRQGLSRRLGASAPEVSSAGTSGWEGSPAVPESVQAAAERGIDISSHVARRLTPSMLESAEVVVCMARDHLDEVVLMRPQSAPTTFTLKELVRLLEEDKGELQNADLATRVDSAEALRREGFMGQPLDQDIADPLGLPLESFRAVAWEVEAWCGRLAEDLGGPLSITAVQGKA